MSPQAMHDLFYLILFEKSIDRTLLASFHLNLIYFKIVKHFLCYGQFIYRKTAEIIIYFY